MISNSLNLALKLDKSTQVCRKCKKQGNSPQKIILTACNHMFCAPCIGSWLDKKSTCPKCKIQIPLTSERQKNQVVKTEDVAASIISRDSRGELVFTGAERSGSPKKAASIDEVQEIAAEYSFVKHIENGESFKDDERFL